MKKKTAVVGCLMILLVLAGCSGTKGNTGNLPTYAIPDEEAEWIRNGNPLVFEDEPWYPQDGVDILLDSEVYLVGTYQNVQIFAERADVRPYNRLYTKFGKNKFRIFKKTNDSNKSAR
jgi:hypothetical protein